MPRSRTGCLTCRQRKLKCSEERPVCSQCQKANRECNPSSGITFRHQQNPSLNSRERGGGALKSFYGYKETFGKGTVWVDVPQQLTFVHTNNPYEDEDDGQSGNQGHNEAGDTTFMTEGSAGYGESSGYDLSQAAFPAYATHGLEALSAVASQDQYSYAPPPAPMSQHDQRPPQQQQDDPSGSPQNANAQQDIDFILNPSSGLPHNPNIDPQLHSETPVPQSTGEQAPPTYPQQQPQSPEHVRTRSYSSSYGRPSLHARKGVFSRRHGRAAIEDAELVFLLRDFSERGGLWMDLFDLDLFFATIVPVLAVRCPLLLYSCAALSAKSLARVDGRKPVLNGQVTEARRSQMEKWSGPPMGVEEWVHKAREYYDLAVSLLRQALAGASRPPTSSLPDDASPQTVASVQGYPLPVTDSDELVAATAILCVYEFLDASGPEWSRHLDGAKSLFDIAKDRMIPLTLQKSPASIAEQATHRLSSRCDTITGHVRPGLSKGRRAIFWNFARQDMLSAFIDNTSTRLDTSDLPMWRNAGLQLTPEGFLCPSNPGHADFDPETAMTDDLIANALIWLLSKLVNFISAGDDVPAALSPSGLGIRQQELLDYWHSLDAQLQAWHDGLPESFTATAIYHPSASVDDDLDAEEHWFPRPLCASSMQSYHFARIQLLHNKPHVSTAAPHAPSSTTLPPLSAHGAGPAATSLAARHASYASILSSSRAHAREIVSISRGRSDEGTRIHSVQPLWTAGMVLGVGGEEPRGETERWRKTILELLRGVEEDMGWASEYRARSLIELWGDEG